MHSDDRIAMGNGEIETAPFFSEEEGAYIQSAHDPSESMPSRPEPADYAIIFFPECR